MTRHASDVPDGGPPLGTLQRTVDGTAGEQDRELVAEACAGRVPVVLSGERNVS